MAIEIAWRNPIPVRQGQRRWKIFKKSERNLYVIQELIAQNHVAIWSNIPKLELVRGGSAPVAAETRAAG